MVADCNIDLGSRWSPLKFQAGTLFCTGIYYWIGRRLSGSEVWITLRGEKLYYARNRTSVFEIITNHVTLWAVPADISSSSSLSCDRSIASSKLSSANSAILSFLLQLPVFSCFLQVIQQLLTSPSSPSCPANLSFNDVFYKAICGQSSWPTFVLLCEECSFPPLLCVILFHYSRGQSNFIFFILLQHHISKIYRYFCSHIVIIIGPVIKYFNLRQTSSNSIFMSVSCAYAIITHPEHFRWEFVLQVRSRSVPSIIRSIDGAGHRNGDTKKAERNTCRSCMLSWWKPNQPTTLFGIGIRIDSALISSVSNPSKLYITNHNGELGCQIKK
jgi:hypothetical protein